MIPFWNRDPDGPSKGDRPRAGTKRLRAEVTELEGRRLLAIGTITANAVPDILTPPNGRFVRVVVSGTFSQVVTTQLGNLSAPPPQPQLSKIDAVNAIKAGPSPVIVRVTDEYRQDEPRTHTTAQLTSTRTFFDKAVGASPALEGELRNYSFSTFVVLSSRSSNNTPDGRHYDINVAVQDGDGANSVTTPVAVPKPNNPIPPPHRPSLMEIFQAHHAATVAKKHHKHK